MIIKLWLSLIMLFLLLRIKLRRRFYCKEPLKMVNLKDGLYSMSLPTSNKLATTSAFNSCFRTPILSYFNSVLSTNDLWHLRLGHTMMKTISSSCKHVKLSNKNTLCSTCPLGKKMHKLFAPLFV